MNYNICIQNFLIQALISMKSLAHYIQVNYFCYFNIYPQQDVLLQLQEPFLRMANLDANFRRLMIDIIEFGSVCVKCMHKCVCVCVCLPTFGCVKSKVFYIFHV